MATIDELPEDVRRQILAQAGMNFWGDPQAPSIHAESPQFIDRYNREVQSLVDEYIGSPAIDDEIAQLEQELSALSPTQGPQPSQPGASAQPGAQQQALQQQGPLQGQAFTPPQAPPLPGGEILQNPLLQAIQGDVTRRVFANQAARRRTGGAETAVALQSALAPTALNLGLTQQAREQAQQQQNIANLMNLFQTGANVAAGQGSQGLAGAGALGSALQAGGLAQAQGALGRGQAISQGLGDIAGFAGLMGGGGFGGTSAPLGGGLFGTPFQPTTSIPFTA